MIRSTETDAPLPPRLTEADRAAHLDFIARLGEGPAWNENKVGDIVKQFPGPIVFASPQLQFWLLILGGAVMTLASMFMTFHFLFSTDAYAGIGVAVGTFGAAFFGLGIVVGVISLKRGANSLRLDEIGFEITSLFRKETFLWIDVSDFVAASGYRMSGFVAFKAAKRRLTNLEKINAALQRGRNVSLSADYYGFATEDLVQLMSAWRSLAVDATK